MEDEFVSAPAVLPDGGEAPELTRAWEYQMVSRQAQASLISTLLGHHDRVIARLCADPRVRRDVAGKAAMEDVAAVLGVSALTATAILGAARFARDELPATWEAFGRGRIDLVRVRKIAQIGCDLEPQVLAVLDGAAAQAAANRSIGDLTGWLTRKVAVLDQQAHARLQAARVRDRCVRFEHFPDGMSLITAYLPTLEAAAIQKRLGITARRLHTHPETSGPRTGAPQASSGTDTCSIDGASSAQGAQDGSHAPTSGGNEAAVNPGQEGWETQPAPGVLPRLTLGQREADVFSAWLRTNPSDAPAPVEAKIMVMIPQATLTGDSQEPGLSADRSWMLSAHQAQALAGDRRADHRWYTGQVRPREQDADVDLLTTTYTGRYPPAGLRDAVIFRDGVCQVVGCTIAAERCDLDHRQPWETGGATRAGNLQALCRRHHRLKSHQLLHPPPTRQNTGSGVEHRSSGTQAQRDLAA